MTSIYKKKKQVDTHHKGKREYKKQKELRLNVYEGVRTCFVCVCAGCDGGASPSLFFIQRSATG